MATNYNSYSRNNWTPGMAITQDRMNTIETGVTENRDNTIELKNALFNSNGTVKFVTDAAVQSKIDQSVGEGNTAYSWLVNAIQNYGESASSNNFSAIINQIKTNTNAIGTERARITGLSDIITNATTGNYANLKERLDTIQSSTNTATQNISNIIAAANGTGNDYGSAATLASRIQEIVDAHRVTVANDTLSKRFGSIESDVNNLSTEINNAHRTNVTDDTIANRFVDIETEITAARGSSGTLVGRLTALQNGLQDNIDTKVGKEQIINNLTSTTAGNVLDAYQGYLLDSRLSPIEIALANAKISSTIRTPGANEGDPDTDTTYASLDARLEAIEGRAVAANTTANNIRADINAIASELAMLDNGAIVNTNTKIDNLEANVTGLAADVQSFADELSMARDENTGRLIDTNTRVDDLSSRMSTVETDIDNLDADLNDIGTGIKARIVELETTVNDSTTGLAATKAIADTNTTNISGLDARLDAIDGGETLTGAKTLATRVGEAENAITNLQNEPKSATEIISVANFNALEENEANSHKDYLVGPDEDNLYKYYHIIETSPGTYEKVLISGGGGSGNNSSIVLNESDYAALETFDEDTDYYVIRQDGVHHYRYVPDSITGETLEEIEIGTNNNYNIGVGTTVETVDDQEVDKTYLYLYKFAPGENSIITDEDALPLLNRGTLIRRVELPSGGTGSGAWEKIQLSPASGQSTVFTAVEGNITPIPLNLQVYKRDQTGYVSTTVNIIVQYRERNADIWRTYTAAEKDISISNEGATTFSTVDISSLLVLNKTMEIKVTATDKNNSDLAASSTIFYISKVELNLNSTFNQATPFTTETITFNYSYTGSGLNKTLHILLNDSEIATRNLGTGIGNNTYNINMREKSAGTYNLTVYYTTDDNNKSNTLNYFIMYIPSNETLTHPIIGISVPETTITEGDALVVYYSAYTQNAEITENAIFEIYTDNASEPYTSKLAKDIENNKYEPILFLDYPIPQDGEDSITITLRATATNEGQDPYSIEQTIVVNRYTDTSIDFNPIASNLIYQFNPATHSNNDVDKEEFSYSPHSGTSYDTTLKDFNWTSNGYLGDEALTFNGDSIMTIKVPVFITNVAGTDVNDTPTANGRTIEFEYEVGSVTDINAPIITYFNNSNIIEGENTNTKTGIGFEITPQNCYLISESKSVVTDKKGFIHNEDNIAAAYLSEGSRLRVSFVIEAVGTHKTGDGKNAQTVNIYINGQYANSCAYDNSESFTIPAEANCYIIIGNDSSILKLYDVRIYNRGLDESEILQNYVTAPLLRRDKLARILENDLLTADKKEIDYYKARQSYNCLLITGNLSPAKSEKVSCGLIFTQPNNEGGFDEKFRCMEKFTNGEYTSQNAVQGTSSVKFPVKNYKVYLTDGTTLDENNEEVRHKYKYALEPGRVKESTFCWKGDYMSSDHANTFNANWADALETRIDGASHVQNSVYGFRCLLFYRPDEKEDTPIVLIGDGTLNNDKGNTKTFQLEDSSDEGMGADTRSQKWEFKNNTETPCLFQSDNLISLGTEGLDYSAATAAFESTYPDEGDLEDEKLRPNYNHIQILLSWVLRRANYWNESDPDLRAAKKQIFKSEFSSHFNMNHMLLYYLFCEFTAMTDNRAKNMFIRCDTVRDEEVYKTDGTLLFSGNSAMVENSDWYNYVTGNNAYKAANYSSIDWTGEHGSTFGIWTPILYDLDSCYGVENSGYLQVPYYAQWNYRDTADTKYLFNGYESLLWLMFEDSFADEIRTMAQTLYANGANGEPGLNYNSFYQYHITDNAIKFPPAIINQDMNKKYLNPWINGLPDPEDATKTVYNAGYKYLQRGSRTDQKVGFIERRSRMLYSKYLTTQFIANEASINFRCGNAGAKDTITLTVGTACYPAIQFSDTSATTISTQQQYANTGESVSFVPSGEGGMGFSDTVYIRGASMLTGVAGIGGYMPYEINLSGGRNLKQLVLGSPTIINTQASALSNLSACSILETLNVENFNGTSFTTLDLSENRLLKNLYATGANNLGTCSFANGGIIENIELGTGLTSLVLRNQTRINTLKFGGSDTVIANNISKINTIFVEGISSAAMNTVQEVLKVRLHALKDQIDNGRNSGEAIVLSGGIRISGLNMTLTCLDENKNATDDAELLDLLINKEAMLGKGLTHDGKPSSSSYPYLAGTLTINRGQDQKVAILRTMYPNLTIIENNPVISYIVTYEHDDGTILATLVVNEGDPAPDIWSTGLLTTMPTKPQTERESYIFGSRDEYDSSIYIRYSGWRLSSETSPISVTGTPSVFSNMRIITYFNAIPRTYQIKWFLDKNPEGRLVKTSPGLVSYGGGYEQEAPTVQDIHNANYETCSVSFEGARVSYKIFNGWEKLPTNINPTANDTYYAIYANWIEGNNITINSLFENTTTLTPEQLLVLSAMDNTMRNTYGLNEKIDTAGANRLVCTMGADSIVEGIDLISAPVRTDSANFTPFTTEIQPLQSGNDAFTLMIDYCFNDEMTESITTNFNTLVSCYYSNISAGIKNGFSLFYGKSGNTISGPRVGFGDMYNSANQSVSVGSESQLNMRNIVVLRHPANEPILYVYSGLNGSTNLPSEVQVSPLNWQNYNSDAYINIGQLGNDADSSDGATRQVSNGKGIIYALKYWPEDLGQGECKRLASWPHEQVTYGISYLSNTATTTNRVTSETAKGAIHLASLSTLSHGAYYQGRVTTSLDWNSSALKTIMNKRIINGLPTKLQSILCKDETAYTIGQRIQEAQGQYSDNINETGIVREYIRPYSLAHVLANDSVYKNAEEHDEKNDVYTAPFPWLDLSNVTIYDYTASGWARINDNDKTVSMLNYLNLRFPNKAITWGAGENNMRIFREVDSISTVPTSTTVADSIYQATSSLRSGDIYIMQKGNLTYTYIYVTNEEMNALGLQPVSTSFDSRLSRPVLGTPNGRWLRADQYWTRSVIMNNSFNFGYVYEQGTPNTNTTNSVDSRGLKFSQILMI